MPTATPDDVEGVIDTALDSGEITNYLEDAEFEARQAIEGYGDELSTTEKTQLEKYLAALRIVETKDRRVSEDSVGDSSMTYEASTVKNLRSQVHARDPSNSLAYTTDGDGRHISTTS
jgi:hypothetical protein